MVEKIKFDYSPKTVPLSHQIEAIEYIKNNDSIPLFDEQGLGKTKTVIDALVANIGSKSIDSVLVICKKSLMQTWKNEITKHSNLFSVILTGSKNQRNRRFVTFSHFYIINYESLMQELDVVKLLFKGKKIAIVLDESHKIKNPEAQVTQAVLSLIPISTKRIIITGTPIANKPEDIWTQMFFLDNGKLLGNDYEAFKNFYGVDLKEGSVGRYKEKLSILRNQIESVAIRRTKDILHLPEKSYFDCIVQLAPIQSKIYSKAKDDLLLEITNLDGQTIIDDIDNYLVKLLRLTQIASNPGLISDDYAETPAKYSMLDTIIKKIITRKEKVIVWTSFRQNVRLLRKRYDEFGSLMIYGDILIEDRNRAVDKFMSDPNYRVLIANPSTAKEGLTLTSANNAIYLDRNFKMDDYLQSQDRIHRIGQTRECKIIKLIAKETIDEYTDEILEKKELLAKYSIGDPVRLENDPGKLTKEDLLKIIGGRHGRQ